MEALFNETDKRFAADTLASLHEQLYAEMQELNSLIANRSMAHASGDGKPADGEAVDNVLRSIAYLNLGIDVMMANSRLAKDFSNDDMAKQLPRNAIAWDDFLRGLREKDKQG